MAQSLHQVYGHIVFSTKDRANLIHGGIEKDLYAYMAGICHNLEAPAILINGMPDHVHVLIRVSKKIADIDFMCELKSRSSHWMVGQGNNGFHWQAGYGWFGVSVKDLEVAKAYVAKQKEHHKTETFQEEYRKFLRKYGIPFDERYVWD